MNSTGPARNHGVARSANGGQPHKELVDASVFAPLSATRGEQFLVQVFLHVLKERLTAVLLARKADPGARKRGVMTLATEIARGQRVDISLDAPGFTIEQPSQNLVWRGEARACQFLLCVSSRAPAARPVLTVRVAVDGLPVGIIRFALEIGGKAETAPRVEMRGDAARRYRHAFLSYASPDRPQVLARAQQLKAAHIDFFQDILSLEPGASWEERLYQEIDRCDVFFLYWSSHAARSKWVLREVRHALRRQKQSRNKFPDITPIILEGPPIPPPPAALKKIHFNDAMRYMIVASEGERLRRPV